MFVWAIILFIAGVVIYENAFLNMRHHDSPSILIGDISSYLTIDEIMKKLERDGYLATIVEEQRLSRTDVRPQFDYVTIKVGNYESFDQRGELKIYLFNDQSERILYCPNDIAAYSKKLLETTRVAQDYIEIKEYSSCIWITDKRVEKKRLQWIKRYS